MQDAGCGWADPAGVRYVPVVWRNCGMDAMLESDACKRDGMFSVHLQHTQLTTKSFAPAGDSIEHRFVTDHVIGVVQRQK